MSYPRLVLCAIVLAGPLGVPAVRAQSAPVWKWYEVSDGAVRIHLYVFYSATCPHCAKARLFLADLQTRSDWLTVHEYETSQNPANLDLYRRMAADVGRAAGQVPAFFHCRQLDIGYTSDETTGRRLEAALVRCHNALQKQIDDRRRAGALVAALVLLLPPPEGAPAEPDLSLQLPAPDEATVDLPWWGAVTADEVSLPALTVVLGGLDAFNPCAFFVLTVLLGLMLHTGSRGKMVLAGAVFVAVSGLVYFLFMAAWLNLFFLVGHLRVITLAAGAVAVAVAAINIKDYFWFKQGVTLSVSAPARSRLVARMHGLLGRAGVLPVVAGTAALAFAANLYELLCTSGLPLVYTRVLTLRELPPAGYYGYLALYNLVYVAPLFLIVLGFALTLSAHKLTEYQGRVLKLVSGMMMLALGVVLVAVPTALSTLPGAAATLLAAVGGAAAVVLTHRALVRLRAPGPAGLGTVAPGGPASQAAP